MQVTTAVKFEQDPPAVGKAYTILTFCILSLHRSPELCLHVQFVLVIY